MKTSLSRDCTDIVFSRVHECDMLINIVGALWFIGVLLVMSGVERNPGPFVEEFNFRYQYLLIEVGTKVIRKVFDNIVGPDLNTFLTKHYAKLQELIGRKKLTPDQQNVLPPIEQSPSSENFDITLLCLLLRNICGLCPPGDKVWIQPATTDKSLEAYITRLRLCRNSVAHSGSVLEDQTKLQVKWTELCDILNELGKTCGFSDLQTLIEAAETIGTDKCLKERFESVLKSWDEMETLFDNGLGVVIGGQEEVRKELKEIRNELENTGPTQKRRRLNEISDIRQKLIDIYQNEFDNLELCPVVKYETGPILRFYQLPSMQVVDYHEAGNFRTEHSHSRYTEVEACKDLFYNGDEQCKNIYLTGNAGMGKTSFSRLMAFLWCNSKLGKHLENGQLKAYADYLARFEFVFYVHLRDTYDVNVISMIVNQLSPYLSDYKRDSLHRVIEKILNDQESLVIMDGLDEWTPTPVGKRKCELPVRSKYLKCVYFTTCRPYKIENVRLSRTDIDHEVKMIGFDKRAIDTYVAALINYMNTNYNENKTSSDFMEAVKRIGLSDLLHIPMITSHLVMLWADRPLISMSRSLIYGNIMDMLFKKADLKEYVNPSQAYSNLNLPDAFSKLNYLKGNISHVEKLCLLSYMLLFKHDVNDSNLVFTREQLASEPYCLLDSEINLFCTIGILSKSQVFRQFGKQELKLCFLHNSYLEFLAAVYVSTFETSKVLDLFNTCNTINNVLKYENFLIFYAGLSPERISSLLDRIYSLISNDLIPSRTKYFIEETRYSSLIYQYINLVLTCYVEGSCRLKYPIPLKDFIFPDRYTIAPFRDDTITYENKTQLLKELLCLNSKHVISLCCIMDEYHDEFDNINDLQWLQISGSRPNRYNVKFNELMLRNKASLHSVCIEAYYFNRSTLLSELQVTSLHNLTSLLLYNLTLSCKCLHGTVKFLSNHKHIKHMTFQYVYCYEGQNSTGECTLSCDFSDCNDLETLKLFNTNLVCSKVNASHLKRIELIPLGSIANNYGNIFQCIQYASKLTYLKINGKCKLNDHAVQHLISGIQFLPNISDIYLKNMDIPDNIHISLHPDVKQVYVHLDIVIMSDASFKSFIKSCTNKQSHNTVTLGCCTVKKSNGDNYCEMTVSESIGFMYNCLTSISTVNITKKDSRDLWFETNNRLH
ncbi:hypothetical protein ACF0H5_021478 [Mactra antiquata]